MEYLYDLGHARVGIVTGPLVSPISSDRLAGVLAAAERRGCASALRMAIGDFSIESGLRQAGDLLDQPAPPTAIFCFSDEMAMGAIEAIRRRGLHCPRDVSLVGFDDIRFAQYLSPQLTTVSQPMEQIGHEVVRLLLDILADRAGALQNVTLPHRLIVRSSTAPPPG
jgi:LacI family repressor for deo operon, udp, cdd, tsx, nupC, and nupG